ncbi:MAG TPA: hypothetical protein VND64_11785 [Pirellulales bacterium]|nr:hypothetical protein [Pirellulales bacterium]
MTHLNCLSFMLALALVTPLASAGPPAPSSRPAISAANADQVHRIVELEKRVDNIARGPGPGEMVFVDWKRCMVEVVDEADFRPLRKIADGRRPGDFAVSKDGRFVTWRESEPRLYVVQEIASGKTVEIDVGEHAGGPAFSPDGKLLAIGFTYWEPNVEGAGESETKLFDFSGKLVRTLDKSGPGWPTQVFSPDGKLLAVGNRNYETRLFEVATGKLRHTLPPQNVA